MTGPPSPKKQRTDSPLVIGTHDGSFHCDEVLACWMLKQLPRYKDATIVRTRDSAKLSECDIVVDVGGVYDPDKNRFDHHQRSFTGTMNSLADLKWVTKLSSAGLVYLHFGKEVIAELTQLPKDDIVVSRLYDRIYERFIEEVDAVDNGIDQYEGTPRYHVTTTIGARVGALNPAWNVANPDPRACFDKAMALCGSEFTGKLNYYKDAWLPARKLVEEAVAERATVDPSNEIMAFKQSSCPWKDHLVDIEVEQDVSPTIKYVLFKDQRGHWMVQCVPLAPGSFKNRLSLCENWHGLRDEALSKLSGIPDCVFVHANGFIGGNKTYEGALKMAKLSLTYKSS